MASLICGSLAFDTIMDFEGRFAEQILPDQLHILNVSFLVPALRRDFGGCAGNIAYSLKILGGTPLPMAIETWALAKIGPSFKPSPTIKTFLPCSFRPCKRCNLSFGLQAA